MGPGRDGGAVVGRWVWRGDEAEVPRNLRDAVADLRPGYAGLVARLLSKRGVLDPESAAAFLRPALALMGLRTELRARGYADLPDLQRGGGA